MKKVLLCLFAIMAVTVISAQVDVDEVDKVYFGNVEENPMFNGKPAEEGFREYVSQRVIYPPVAQENSITGRVFVEFIVEKDGSVSNLKVVGSVDPILDAEALRVINSSPNWSPGKVDGKAVRMSYTFPFSFRIDGLNNTSSSREAELSDKTTLLKEVVIVGYGVQRRENVVPRE